MVLGKMGYFRLGMGPKIGPYRKAENPCDVVTNNSLYLHIIEQLNIGMVF